ncbi:MAG: hypothetical protein V7L25_22215 [Nostoc sp.]
MKLSTLQGQPASILGLAGQQSMDAVTPLVAMAYPPTVGDRHQAALK